MRDLQRSRDIARWTASLGTLVVTQGSHRRDGWAMEGKVMEEKGDKKAEIMKSRGHRREGSQKGEARKGEERSYGIEQLLKDRGYREERQALRRKGGPC